MWIILGYILENICFSIWGIENNSLNLEDKVVNYRKKNEVSWYYS